MLRAEAADKTMSENMMIPWLKNKKMEQRNPIEKSREISNRL
jgi:hypothetical protein